MSGWKVLVNELRACGGGPLISSRFDALGPGQMAALTRARRLGLIERVGTIQWKLTQRAHDYFDGRLHIVERKNPGSHTAGRLGLGFAATWLSPLPKPNQVRTQGGPPFEYSRV